MSADSDCRLLFVYGTLRNDSAHPMARYLASVARFLGQASTPGRLYDLGPYPGMTAAVGASEWVWGHLFKMDNPADTLERCDAYESCPLGDAIPAVFQRHLMQVLAEDGETYTAWIYTFHGEVKEEMRLANGEYMPSAR